MIPMMGWQGFVNAVVLLYAVVVSIGGLCWLIVNMGRDAWQEWHWRSKP